MAETLLARRERLNKESIALRKTIKKKRLRLSKVRAALKKLRDRNVKNGIDVSVHQGTVDYARVKASGETWVGIKATEGTGFVDSRFAQTSKGARAANLSVAAYAFGRPDTSGTVEDARNEARDFVNVVRGQGGRFIGLRNWEAGLTGVLGVLDFEVRPFSATWAAAWSSQFQAMTGVKPVIYGFGASLNPIADQIKASFSGVWFAAFVNDWKPYCVDALEPLVFQWQWTSSGTVPGVNGHVDRNRRI
jgi:lysozyme